MYINKDSDTIQLTYKPSIYFSETKPMNQITITLSSIHQETSLHVAQM